MSKFATAVFSRHLEGDSKIWNTYTNDLRLENVIVKMFKSWDRHGEPEAQILMRDADVLNRLL